MASFTISNANSWWANSTSVSVYALDAFGNQTGSSVTSASVTSGAVTFTGLTAAGRYVATANSKSVKFRAEDAQIDRTSVVTQTEYDAISSPDANTLYVIVG